MIQKSIGPNRYFCCYYVIFYNMPLTFLVLVPQGPTAPYRLKDTP